MTDRDASPDVPAGLRWLAFATALTTLGLIALGGLLTSKGAGMSVPDWPTTYGYNMFFFPIEQWTGGIFYEHTHRLVASVVGLLTAVLAGWIWFRETGGTLRWTGIGFIVATLGLMGVRTQTMFLALAAAAAVVLVACATRLRGDAHPLRWWAAIAFCAVLIQGVLGGVRVTAMKDEIGIFHGTLAQLFLVLVSAIAFSMTGWWRRLTAATGPGRWTGMRGALTVLSGMVLLQLILGASMRHQHAGLAVPDFPLAHGKLWPATDAESIARYNQQRLDHREFNEITAGQVHLHMAHRCGAVVLLAAAAWLVARARRTELAMFSRVWLGMILTQAGLGVFTVLTNKAADIATLHQFVGAGVLVTMALAAIAAHAASRRTMLAGVDGAASRSAESVPASAASAARI